MQKPTAGLVSQLLVSKTRIYLKHNTFRGIEYLFFYIEDNISILSYNPFRFVWFPEATSPNDYDNTVYMNNALKVLQHEV